MLRCLETAIKDLQMPNHALLQRKNNGRWVEFNEGLLFFRGVKGCVYNMDWSTVTETDYPSNKVFS